MTIPKEFTLEQEEFFNGLMLGDGGLTYSCDRSKFPRLCMTRKSSDIEYLYIQYNLFSNFYSTLPKISKLFDPRNNKTYEKCYSQTLTGELFKTLHKKWYHDKIKIIPRDLKLSDLTILIWFLDDGCIVKSGRNSLTIKFSTNGFLKSDVEFLAEKLKIYTDENFNIYKNGTGYILKASTIPTMKIIDIINPIFPQCMSRKKTWEGIDFSPYLKKVSV